MVAEWKEQDPVTADRKTKGSLLDLLDRKQEEYRRYVSGANAAARKGWDRLLEKIMESDEVASALRKDDLYNLANVGINDD
jgi:predicted metalloendopeptidase